MRRSKLEMYVDILQVLSLKGPLKLTHIMYKSNVNCKVLKSQLDFLLQNGLVEERSQRKDRVLYAITQKGMKTLKAFRDIKQVFPVEKEIKQSPFLY